MQFIFTKHCIDKLKERIGKDEKFLIELLQQQKPKIQLKQKALEESKDKQYEYLYNLDSKKYLVLIIEAFDNYNKVITLYPISKKRK